MSDTKSQTAGQAPLVGEVIVTSLVKSLGHGATFGESADILVAALAEAGYAIVPREPTEAMIDAGCAVPAPFGETDGEWGPPDPEDIWRAMIAAALGEKP